MSSLINTGTLSLAGAVLAALALFIFGRRSGLKSGANNLAEEKAKTKQEETKKEISESVAKASAETAKMQGITQGEYYNVASQIDYARKTNDIEFALRIASNMAQKALNKGASEK